MDKGLTPPTLHDLERPPKWTRVGPPQPFTTWRAFLSRKLTADFLLPNSAYKMCHLHWFVGRSPGSPFVASSREGVAPRPTVHDLERLPNGQGLDAPNPSRFGAALAKGQGLHPPNLHDLERLPNPSRFGAVLQWTRIAFTIQHDLQMDTGWGS